MISYHHDDLLVGHFRIDKTWKLIGRKYYWLGLKKHVEFYVRRCNVCLVSKAVCHKSYGNLQSLPVPTYCWKDLSIDFVTGLPISTNWKGDSYDSILVIVDWLTKIIHYKPIKVIIDTPRLVKVILNNVVWHHGLPDSIVTNRGLLFTLKFSSSLCYFLSVKQKLLTAFHSQTDG